MKPRDIFLSATRRKKTPRPATGSAVSVVTADLMSEVGAAFPQAHLDPTTMADLAEASYTVLGFDNVMPLFSVWHESEALGCQVNWGDPLHMPDSRGRIYAVGDDIRIPTDLLGRRGCRVPLEALTILRKRIGGEAAIIGRTVGVK